MRAEEELQFMMDFYPELFPTRKHCLNHLFCVIGNGYKWTDGELVDKDDEFKKRYHLTQKIVKAKPRNEERYLRRVEIEKEIQRKKGDSYQFTPQNAKYHFQWSVPSKECSLLYCFPPDIKEDWFALIKECERYLEKDGIIISKEGEETMAKETETKERFDITKQELRVYDENFYFDDSRNAFVALYEYSFNPDEYFGTTINKPNGPAHLCFLTQWEFCEDKISMYYYGDFPESEGNVELEKKLTMKEEIFFRDFMTRLFTERYAKELPFIHRPMTAEERQFFIDTDKKILGDETVTSYKEEYENGEDEEDGGDWEYRKAEDEGEVEFKIAIKFTIQFPETGSLDEETAFQDVSNAFSHTTMNLNQVDDMDYWLDDDNDILHISFITGAMDYNDNDGTEAMDFCYELLDEAKKELRKIGCKMDNENCSIAKD